MRPGKQTVYSYGGLFLQRTASYADDVPGDHDPNEQPWQNPSNATLGIPGQYAEVIVNAPAQSFTFTIVDAGNGDRSIGHLFPVTISPGVMVNVGDTIAIGIQVNYQPFFGTINVAPTDSGGNSYSLVGNASFASSNLDNNLFKVYVAPVTTGGILDFIFTGTGSGSGNFVCLILDLTALGPLAAASSPAFYDPAVSTTQPTNTVPASDNSLLLAFSISRHFNNVSTDAPFTVTNSSGDTVNAAYYQTTAAGTYDCVFHPLGGIPAVPGLNGTDVFLFSFPIMGSTTSGPPYSDKLHALNFPVALPLTAVMTGFEFLIDGKQSSLDLDAILSITLLTPTADTPVFTGQLPMTDGTIVLSSPTTTWGLPMVPATFNNPNFGFSIVASDVDGDEITFDISAVAIRVWFTPDPTPSINYIKTFTETGGEILTLMLASTGSIYQEDVINNPGVLTSVYSAVEPDTFAQSATVDNREFMAFSNLQIGTDIPLTYTPPIFDRCSQVGSGTKPTLYSYHKSSGIPVGSITRTAPTQIRRISWVALLDAVTSRIT